MSNPAEVSFARRISPVSRQWATVMHPSFTGLEFHTLLIIDTGKEEGAPNCAIFEFKDGDRHGKPIWKGVWRLNPNPVGQSPSFWVDTDILPLAVWCEPNHWCIQRAKTTLDTVREYEF